jgi:broad specificity phosphatase PhoE
MTENMIEPKADAQGDKLDAIMSLLGKTISRLDEMETKSNLPAPPLVTAADKTAKADGADDMPMKAKADEMEKPAPMEKSDSEGKVEMPAGEMKFDEDEEEESKSKMDEDEEAKKCDEDEAAYADCQAKADSVYSAFGKSASRPLQGESLMAYRKRMVRGLQAHSDEMKNVNINAIKDEAMLSIVEKRVYADAVVASRGTGAIGKGQLIELHKTDRAGRTITEFRGDMEAWLGEFKLPASRVVKFHTENFKR